MKVLFITNMFPTSEKPYFGVFVKEQIDGLIKYSSVAETKIILIKGYKGVFNYLKSIVAVNWHLINNKYDIIHVHYGLSGLFLLFKFGKRENVILTLHGSDINIESSNKLKVGLTSIVLKYTNYIVCVNEKMVDKIKWRGMVRVIPCGVNTDLFVEKKDNKQSNVLQIIFPSSSNRPEKNFQLFEAIINHIKKVIDLDIRIIKIENMSRQSVAKTLQDADLMIMTSISEGSPQIIKEAMACNLPIVSTDIGDVRNLLFDVKNCYVINSFLPDDFINPILSIINLNTEDRVSNGRNRIFELGVNSEITSKKVSDFYKLVLNKGSLID